MLLCVASAVVFPAAKHSDAGLLGRTKALASSVAPCGPLERLSLSPKTQKACVTCPGLAWPKTETKPDQARLCRDEVAFLTLERGRASPREPRLPRKWSGSTRDLAALQRKGPTWSRNAEARIRHWKCDAAFWIYRETKPLLRKRRSRLSIGPSTECGRGCDQRRERRNGGADRCPRVLGDAVRVVFLSRVRQLQVRGGLCVLGEFHVVRV